MAELPPGPRLPKWIETAGFLFQGPRWVDWNRKRYGGAREAPGVTSINRGETA